MKRRPRKLGKREARMEAWGCGAFPLLYGWVTGYPALAKGEQYSDYPEEDVKLLKKMKRLALDIQRYHDQVFQNMVDYLAVWAPENEDERRAMEEYNRQCLDATLEGMNKELEELKWQWEERERECVAVAEELMGEEYDGEDA